MLLERIGPHMPFDRDSRMHLVSANCAPVKTLPRPGENLLVVTLNSPSDHAELRIAVQAGVDGVRRGLVEALVHGSTWTHSPRNPRLVTD